jgi:O-antigen/teichoic acid export membrane protein
MAAVLKRMLRSDLVASSGIYTIATVVNAGIPFLLMPILTRYLTPGDYGLVSMFFVLSAVATPLVGLNVHGAISVRYFDGKEPDLPRYIGNCFFILFLSTGIVCLAATVFAGPIRSLTMLPGHWLLAAIFVAFGQFVVQILLTLWQAENRPKSYGVFQVLQTSINLGLSILLVVSLGRMWEGRLEANLITTVVFAFAAFAILWKSGRVRFRFDGNRVKDALRFGVPLIPHALGGMLILQTDRIFITSMVSVADAGIYTVGFQIAFIVELLASSFNRAYVPWLYRKLHENDLLEKRKIVRFTYAYFALCLLFAIGLSLVAPWFLGFFVGREFTGAYRYIIWISLGFAFSAMYYMVSAYIFFAGRTHLLAWVTILSALLNILLNYLLIRRNGPVGAAQASAVAFLVSFLLTWALGNRAYRMPWALGDN